MCRRYICQAATVAPTPKGGQTVDAIIELVAVRASVPSDLPIDRLRNTVRVTAAAAVESANSRYRSISAVLVNRLRQRRLHRHRRLEADVTLHRPLRDALADLRLPIRNRHSSALHRLAPTTAAIR